MLSHFIILAVVEDAQSRFREMGPLANTAIDERSLVLYAELLAAHLDSQTGPQPSRLVCTEKISAS